MSAFLSAARISGYASLDWRGKGSLNETSGVNRTPNSQKMFSATSKKSWLLTDVAQTMDVLEAAVNLAYEGRPGPVHIHVPENLTHHGVEVNNYRDLRLVVKPVLPDPARVAEIADYLADAFAKGKKVVALVGFGAIRAGAGAEVRRLIERFQLPLLTTLDGKGIVEESHPLAVGVFCDSGHATAWKAFLDADVVIAVGNSLNQHATFGYRADLFANRTLIHINISEMEIDKAYKADYALVADAKRALVALIDALEKKVGPRPPANLDRRDYEAQLLLPRPGGIHPGKLAQSNRTDAAAARHPAGRRRRPSRLAGLLRRARRRPELPQAGHVRTDGRSRQRRHRAEASPSRPRGGGGLRRRLLLAFRFRADDRRRAFAAHRLDHLQ